MCRFNYLVSAILTAVLCISGNLPAYSGDGDGSPEYPYQISSVEDWQELMAAPDDWSSSFILTADVNLAGVSLTPIGNSTTQFTGVFDGNDNIISNALINQPGSNYIGLFGRIGSVGQILNLGVEDVNMTGHQFVGGLAGSNGYNYNGGNITSCYATGSVSGGTIGSGIGGLVGHNGDGSITDSYADASVSGNDGIGGLVGESFGGTITSCYATGLITGIFAIGGLMGSNDSTVTDCYATGSVDTNDNQYAGGLVGWNSGNLTNCFATGSVSGFYNIGGLVATNGGTLRACYATGLVSGTGYLAGGLVGDNEGPIIDCFATSPVDGNNDVGGLVGHNGNGTLTDCFATGLVTGAGDNVGGLVGYIYSGSPSGCFWDIQTSSQPTSAGGTGKTTAEMKTLSTFTSAGWDFVETWGIEDNQTYPFLKLTYPVGDLNHNGAVDFLDFAVLASHWLDEI